MAEPHRATNAYSATLTLMGEDYTLANALCAMLNRDPHVEFCGASAPHPSDDFINIRIQTTGPFILYSQTINNGLSGTLTAKQALKEAAEDVKRVCEHIKQEYKDELTRHRSSSA